jgi:hypothetical protein
VQAEILRSRGCERSKANVNPRDPLYSNNNLENESINVNSHVSTQLDMSFTLDQA